jgi:hypothetical protein
MSWTEVQKSIARACDENFSRRLTWAKWLQRLIFLPFSQTRVGNLIFQSETAWEMIFNKTR